MIVPFSVFADDGGTVGTNMGLDFYSRIDDAGDRLAQGIVDIRLKNKKTYASLGCGAKWLGSEPIDGQLLEDLTGGNYALLLRIASQKNVTLTTPALSSLSQCLAEKYNDIQKAAHEDGNTLENVGNIGLYTDGDTANSDYDLVADITRINSIIFREKYDYNGTKNGTAGAIGRLLAGTIRVGPLFLDDPLSPSTSGENPP